MPIEISLEKMDFHFYVKNKEYYNLGLGQIDSNISFQIGYFG